MPVCATLDEDLNLVYVNPKGTATTQELLECIEEYADEPAFHPEIDVLLDLRSMRSYELGKDTVVERLMRTVARTRDGRTNYRMACLVGSDTEETLIALSRNVLYRADEAESFYDVSAALRWLGHDEATDRVAAMRRRLGE